MEEILGLPAGALKDSDTRDTIESWSSVADVQIISGMTADCGIEPDAEIMEAESVGDLLAALDDRGAFAG